MLSESSAFVSVTSDTSADSDGAYVRLIASTSRAYQWMVISCTSGTASVTGLLDISVGASGNEVEFLSDRMLRSGSYTFPRKFSHLFWLPVTVASGVEIRARVKDTSSSGIVWNTKIMLSDVGPPDTGTPTKLDAAKVNVTSSSSADTYGSYVNLITSAAHTGKWLLIGCGSTVVASNVSPQFGIGVGNPPTGTDEIDAYGFVKQNDGGGQGSAMSQSILLPCDFAQGNQLQVRVKDDIASALTYNFSIQLLG